MERRYGDQGTLDKYEEDTNNGDCNTEPVRGPCRWPCSACQKGVGNNLVFCVFCEQWLHKRCSVMDGSWLYVQKVKLDHLRDYR